MILLAALLQASAPSPVPPSPDRADDIVVVAGGADRAQAALAACIARKCPPDQEIRAALVYSTRQFLTGDYTGSRRTLLASRSRNSQFDKTYPLEVSDLHRAIVRLSNLDGRPDSARLAAFDATDALQAGLRPDDPMILLQRLETAQQLARQGRLTGAVQIYDDVIGKARKKGYHSVEGQGMFGVAAIYATIASVDPDYRSVARKRAAQIERRTEPEFADYREGLKLLKLKIDSLRTTPGKRASEIAQASVGIVAVNDAVLLHEPMTDFSQSSAGLANHEGGNGDPEWADVAFWVRPDGSVGDVQVIGRSKPAPGSWLAIKTKAVSARRYAPLKPRDDMRGLYRVERYSMVYSLGVSTESRIPVRSAQGELETTDITAAHRPPPLG